MSANRETNPTVERKERDKTKESIEAFVATFSAALQGYLGEMYRAGAPTHLVDYAVATSNFAEAFYHTAVNFNS